MWIPTKPLAQIALHHEYLRHVNPNKATGPDNTAPRVLKACAEQLAYIFCIIFNACFSTNTVPTTWKTACIVPIPKRPVISSMNDLRPVTLTSAVMRVCERVVLCKLEKLVKDYIDPLQFAYRKNRSTDCAIFIRLRSLLLYLCYVFRMLIGSIMCWLLRIKRLGS